MVILLYAKILLDLLSWEEISLYGTMFLYNMLKNGKYILDYQQQELIASMNMENKPQLSLANSRTLPGRSLAVVCVSNNLEPDQSGQIYDI